MYYLIEGLVDGHCDWVVEADSMESAKAMIEEDERELATIREISVEERIEREENELREAVQRDYINRRCGDCTVREYSNIQKQLRKKTELYYKALVDFNKAHRLSKRLARRNNYEALTMAEYNELINKLVDAKTEEEFNAILQSVDKKD